MFIVKPICNSALIHVTFPSVIFHAPTSGSGGLGVVGTVVGGSVVGGLVGVAVVSGLGVTVVLEAAVVVVVGTSEVVSSETTMPTTGIKSYKNL